METSSSSLSQGVAVIRAHIDTMPASPGVYRMLDKDGRPLYVGKAKHLPKRVTAYTHPEKLPYRLQRMISLTTNMEIITTRTEAEALLLEANLIKTLEPKYNILLRDDKSYPYILVSRDHPYPQITKHRGARKRKGEYFGPFASAGDVNATITQLQKLFQIRPCTDSYFADRKRPCLQYQIKRCSAPCVGKISEEEYAQSIAQACAMLSGKSTEVQQQLAVEMEAASAAMEYEKAASLRDRIRALTAIQSRQALTNISLADADVLAMHREGGECCIQVFFYRGGQSFGNKPYFPAHTQDYSDAEVMGAFVGQFYQNHPPPRLILLSHPLEETEAVEEALAVLAGYTVKLAVPKQGDKTKLVELAARNAKEALARRLSEAAAQTQLLAGVATLFDLPAPPRRIEVYDNSHIMGRHAVGAMIVAGPAGFMKQHYRRFTIRSTELTPGDDYAMMREVMQRRFSRLLREENDAEEGNWPDLLLIDGGMGHLKVVTETLQALGITNLPIVAIAKGPDRNAGREEFFMAGRRPFQLPPADPVLYYLQNLRDEAHRFAISSHRIKRSNALQQSLLDEIPHIGPRRKKALLQHFGSAKAVQQATIEDLMQVEGIHRALAEEIYGYWRE